MTRLVLAAVAATAFTASVLADGSVVARETRFNPSAGASTAPPVQGAVSVTGQRSLRSVISTTPPPEVIRPRTPLEKQPSSSIFLPQNRRTGQPEVTGRVLVKFKDELRVRAARTPSFIIQSADGTSLTSATEALNALGGGVLWQAIDQAPEWFVDVESRVVQHSGEAPPDLAGFIYVTPANDDLVACARAFNDLEEVEFVSIEQIPIQSQQVGAQTNCGTAPGNGCQNPPGSVNCNKPGQTSGLLGPPPWGRCTGVITGSVCSDDCMDACVMGVDNPNCMKGCNDATCCGAIVALLPACTGDFHGWDGLCAAYANSMCNRTVYDSLLPVSGNGNSVPGNFKYDPCFALRTGPDPTSPDQAIQATFLSAIGFPPAANFPFELVKIDAFSTAVTPPPFGDSGLVTAVSATAVNPAFLSSAKLAQQDPSFERIPYQTTPTCFTIHPGRKGCSNTPCCVWVCTVDPSCCVTAWDADCVRVAMQQDANNPCVQPVAGSTPASLTPGPADFPTLNMANFPAAGLTPNFKSSEINTGFGKQARNLQAWIVGAPIASPLEQLEIDPAVGMFAVSAPTNTSQLSQSRMFLNTGFRGGGLNLGGFEEAAAAIGAGGAAAQGTGITIGVIDNSAFVNHEDLAGQITVEPGFSIVTTPSSNVDPNHGTAVLGIILANDNGFGVTGVASKAKGYFFPAVAGGGVGVRFFNALASAVGTLKVGDVLCIPLDFPTFITDPLTGEVTTLQGTVLQAPEVFLLTQTAASLGITVVVAAGNECTGVVTAPGGAAASSAIVVGAVWPGAPRYGAVFEGLQYCRSEFSNFTQSGGNPGSNEVDVAGWGAFVTTCGYGDLWRGNGGSGDDSGNVRSYTLQFGGTSAASAMIAGCAARMQSLAKAVFGVPVSASQIKNTMKLNRHLQCGFPDDSPLQLLSSDPCAGDTLTGTGDFNSIGGFIDMGPGMVSGVANQPFGSLPPGVTGYEIQVLVGRLLSGSSYSVRANDSVWLRILAARPGQFSPNPGFGPGLFYPSTSVISDLMVTITTTFTKPEELYGLAVTAWGQAQPNPNVYATFFVYNKPLNRWLMLPQMLEFFTADENPDVDGDSMFASGQVADLYNPINLIDTSSGFGKIRVRAVTIAPPTMNIYQAWWDAILVEPNPVLQPPPPCWIARSVYGTSTPHWILFREWLDHHAPGAVQSAYAKLGEPISKWLARSTVAKALARPVLDTALETLSAAEKARALRIFGMTEEGRRFVELVKTVGAAYAEASTER